MSDTTEKVTLGAYHLQDTKWLNLTLIVKKEKVKMQPISAGKIEKSGKMYQQNQQPIISQTFQMEWYVPFDFPTRISGFSL